MTFFCTPEFLETQDAILRRMIGTGQGIGILADAEDPERTVLEQLEAGNAALEQAIGCKTRLVRVENGNDELLEEVQNVGYCPEVSGLKTYRYTLTSKYQAELLFRAVSTTQKKSSVVWLGDQIQGAGLLECLSQAMQEKELVLPLTETTKIY